MRFQPGCKKKVGGMPDTPVPPKTAAAWSPMEAHIEPNWYLPFVAMERCAPASCLRLQDLLG